MIKKIYPVLLALPFIFIMGAFYLTLEKDIAISFTPAEVEAYRFNPGTILSDTEIVGRPHLKFSSKIRGPINASGLKAVKGNAPHMASGLIVNFIFIGENDKRAVINDQIVREGDKINGGKVARIKKDGVALIINGVIKWIKLEEQ
ncbi:MAG TPA: hypothetical protein ENH38_01975 [Nitrospirae bacterium]|nr:hypothetical protein [Nitrospirota bacterium]